MFSPDSATAVVAELLFVAILIIGLLLEGHWVAALLSVLVVIGLIVLAKHRASRTSIPDPEKNTDRRDC